MSKIEQIMVLVKDAFMSGFNAPATYNDCVENDPECEFDMFLSGSTMKAIEALAQPAGEAEPVAQWQKKHPLRTDGLWENTNGHDAKWWRDNAQGWDIRALYTTPQQSQPLTDEHIADMCGDANRGFCIELDEYTKAVRDTEAAHGIKKGGTE